MRGIVRNVPATLLALVLAACASGQTSPSPSTPATRDPTAGPTHVPGPGSSATSTPAEPIPFVPPDPRCPAPPIALDPPTLLASVDDDTIPVRMESSTVVTCSTTGSWDAGPMDTASWLSAEPGASVRFVLADGWRFLYWEGWDRPADGDGVNILPGAETPEGPSSIDVPVPSRTGDSILGVEAWVISADERTIASISGAVLLRRP